jgi:hypothetical protein
MYAQFMTELCRFILDAGVAMATTIRGCTAAEIAGVESRLGIPLPVALVEYLRVAGHSSWTLMDGEELTIASFDVAQRVAAAITTGSGCPWTLPRRTLPFLQHHGYEFLCLRTDDGNDPPVWLYIGTEPGPQQWAPSFTCWLRECALECIELQPWSDEVCRKIALHRDDWLKRKAVLDLYDQEANRIRQTLNDRVVALDRARGKITSPREFQEIWSREFRETDLCRTLVKEGKRVPWGWIDPGDA